MAQESEAMTEQKSQSQVHYFLNATCMIAKISQKELDSGNKHLKSFPFEKFILTTLTVQLWGKDA